MRTRNFIRRTLLIISLLIFFISLMSISAFARAPSNTNSAPVIINGTRITLTANENTAGQISLSATDKNNDPLIWSISTPARYGTASVTGNANNASVTYAPKADYYGSDIFTVKVSDGKSFDTITVNVKIISASVNHSPVVSVSSLSLTTNQNTSVSAAITASDADNDTLTWSISVFPANGTAIINPSGTSITIIYTPAADFSGTDAFNVCVSDSNGGTAVVTVTVTVNPISTPPVLNYVALGDSIATGTIYPGKTITSYVTYFYQYLKTENPAANVILKNYSTDGDRTNELLSKLQTNTSGIADAVKSADVITVSIGGNNLMQAAKDSSSLGGYNFNNINTAVAEQGTVDFAGQFTQIISKIKEYNPDVKIIVITMYNPYNESDSSLHNTVDSFLFRNGTGINDIIYNNTVLGYKVADVYSAFDQYAINNNMKAVTYFYATDWWGKLTRNPHPNAAGQSILTQLHIEAYKQFTGSGT